MCDIVEQAIEERRTYAIRKIWDLGYHDMDLLLDAFPYTIEKIREILGENRLERAELLPE